MDWTAAPSRYTHDAQGNRVDAYAQPVEPIAASERNFQRSGYRHYRSTIQAGASADNLHVVEQWGGQVQPYEEWRFPYRPYSTPYPNWGPQPPIIGWYPPYSGVPFPGPWNGGGFQAQGTLHPPGPIGPNLPAPYSSQNGHLYQNNQPYQNGWGYPGYGMPGYGPSWGLRGANGQPPWIDGYWPNQTDEGRMSDREFFQVPRSQ